MSKIGELHGAGLGADLYAHGDGTRRMYVSFHGTQRPDTEIRVTGNGGDSGREWITVSLDHDGGDASIFLTRAQAIELIDKLDAILAEDVAETVTT